MLAQFLVEAVVLSVIGGIVGIVVGATVALLAPYVARLAIGLNRFCHASRGVAATEAPAFAVL